MEHGLEDREPAPEFIQGTAPTAREINRAVRARYPSPNDVLIASVIDLSIVPPVYWMTVGMVLNTGRAAAIVVIDENSNIAGVYQGEQPVEAVLDMLDTL